MDAPIVKSEPATEYVSVSSSGSDALIVPTAVWSSATVKLSVRIAGDSLTSVRVTVMF